MKIFKNLRSKLILSFALILIIPALYTGVLSFFSAKDAVRSEILAAIGENIFLLNESIDNVIKPKMHDIDYLSGLYSPELMAGEDSPNLRIHLNDYVQYHPEIQSIYIGTSTGEFIQEPKVAMADDYDPRKRDWYIQALEKKGETVISSPYISAGTDMMVITISKATADGQAVAAVNINLGYIQELTSKVTIGNDGFAFLLDQAQNIIIHPDFESGSVAQEDFLISMYNQEKGIIEYEKNGDSRILNYITNETTGWKIAGIVISSEINEAASPIFKRMAAVLFTSSIIGVIAIYFIIRSIVNPIRRLRDKVLIVSEGDLTAEIKVDTNDDLGQLGSAFNDMQKNLRSLVEKVDVNAEQVAASSEQLTASAEQTSKATEQVAAAIQEVAGSAEKQTSKVDENSIVIHEISQGVSAIAASSSHVSKLSLQTTVQAEEGGQAVKNTVSQMQSIQASVLRSNEMIESLYERSKRVSSILEVITGIADQTNLLSLNAAIEAARAGEHGKGFAVVANEVRKLAEQSQQSVEEIHQIIQDIQQDTKNSVETMVLVKDDVETGVNIANSSLEKFDLILQSTKEITPQMEDVSSTAHQISARIADVAATVTDLAIMAKGNAATSEEVAASTEEQSASMEEISASAQALSSMAEELKELIAVFKY